MTSYPSGKPSSGPSSEPSATPSCSPTGPSSRPSSTPSAQPSSQPSSDPTQPSSSPSTVPSSFPSSNPTGEPSSAPSSPPTSGPTQPSSHPSSRPSRQPSGQPSGKPTQPSSQPTGSPSQPSGQPSSAPTTATQRSCMAGTYFDENDVVCVIDPEGAVHADFGDEIVICLLVCFSGSFTASSGMTATEVCASSSHQGAARCQSTEGKMSPTAHTFSPLIIVACVACSVHVNVCCLRLESIGSGLRHGRKRVCGCRL